MMPWVEKDASRRNKPMQTSYQAIFWFDKKLFFNYFHRLRNLGRLAGVYWRLVSGLPALLYVQT
jgi:hypothetical protein